MQRSGNWHKLFNPRSRMIEPRYENGAFPAGYDNRRGGGFVEGNSVQYSWMVPHDPAGLAGAMGGRARATGRLGHFLRKLNAGAGGTHADHALLGNEPTLHVPWLYDWLGRPDRTQAAVRRALRLYSPAPAGYPGNDDLGTLSSWYVFSALGLYPEVPGVGLLAIGSPLFPRATVALAHRRHLVISTVGDGPYIRSLMLDGHTHRQPWTAWCALANGAHLSFQLGRRPNRQWGSSAAAAPPSFGPGSPMPKDACTP
jgi:predicted alpha-1,2-mannosidase